MRKVIEVVAKKYLAIILVLVIAFSSCSPVKVYAATMSEQFEQANKNNYSKKQQQLGIILSEFAKNFYEEHGAETRYPTGDVFGPRAVTYTGVKYNGYYQFDCVGWISFALHQSLKMGGNSFTEFAIPPYNNYPGFFNGISLLVGNVRDGATITRAEVVKYAKPGDILLKKRSTCFIICR